MGYQIGVAPKKPEQPRPTSRISQGLWRNGANRTERLTHVVKEMVESCGLPSSSWGSRETRGQPSASLKA